MSDITGWLIAKDCDDGSLILQSPIGERKHIWQGGDEKLLEHIKRYSHHTRAGVRHAAAPYSEDYEVWVAAMEALGLDIPE